MKLAEKVSDIILDRIASGYYSIGQLMPAESEIAEELEVSRLTLRESIKNLAARGVLEVRHGKRNRVASPEQWSVVDPQLAQIRGKLTGDPIAWITQLMEARHIIEVGASELAATRITNEQLEELERSLQSMREANENHDSTASVTADMIFHRTIIKAANNEYISATYAPLEEILETVRRTTSSSPEVRADAEHWHSEIYAALAARSPQKTRDAMRSHMSQTLSAVYTTHKENQ